MLSGQFLQRRLFTAVGTMLGVITRHVTHTELY